MEKHSRYFNLNPEEAMQKFMKRNKLRVGIAMLFLVLLLCSLLLQGNSSEYTFFWFAIDFARIVAMPVILLLYVLLQRADARQLQMVLYMDCDPAKMLDIITLWEKRDRNGKAKNTFLLLKAQCCKYIPERLDEGLACLQQINFTKKQLAQESILLFLFAQYSKIRGDRESFDRVKIAIEQLPALYPGNTYQKSNWEKAMQLVKLEELLWDGKAEEARTLVCTLLDKEPYQLSKVGFHMQLAQLDIEAGEYANAKQHLEYVIAHGNRLTSVSEAKERLEAI
ncbi:MAG: hypothetical protein NC089_01545 [Bacteroides sp.]|nr:hypothetical protein [Bacteroides sp.]MCM1548807.1 hypothetical protein [Clostridium sp.]